MPVDVSPVIQTFIVAYRGQGPPESVDSVAFDHAAMEGQSGSSWRLFVLSSRTTGHSAAVAKDAFGILIGRTGTTPNRYLYCGYEFCEPLGQYYLRARIYDQNKGRFHTMDSYEGDNEDPIGLHKYMYANGSPLNFMDPSGHFSLGEIMATMAGFSDIRASYIMNVVTAGAISARNVALISLAPMLRMIGQLPVNLARGRQLDWTDWSRRFFVQDTSRHPAVSSGWVGRMLQRIFPGIKWEQGHTFIQKKWFDGAAINQLYPNDPAARAGLRRLGNAGANLMVMPRWLNNRLGRSRIGTLLFGTAVAAVAVYDVISIYNSSIEAAEAINELFTDD